MVSLRGNLSKKTEVRKMDTRKLLVADASAGFCAALADALGGAYELRFCHDGLQARSLLDGFQPDILVTDLALPGLDGISVLKAAACAPKRPVMLVTTRYTSPYIENAMEELAVDYVVMKPCDVRALVERIQDLSQCTGGTVSLPNSCTASSSMLLALGVPVKRKGFACLETAIELIDRDPRQSVTKALYPAVAKIHGCSRESVERAIRGAIQAAWDHRDEKVWRLYFTLCREGHVPRPTNSTFITTLARRLRQQRQNCENA